MLRVTAGQKLLFVGDSITDCDHRTIQPPLGHGFVQMLAWLFAVKYPGLRLDLVNRGTAGETSRDLLARWETDVIREQPDWMFLMIGVNDVIYRGFARDQARAVEDGEYAETMARLVRRTQAETAARIVLIEPTSLDHRPDAPLYHAVESLCAVLRRVGAEYDVEVCPLHRRMAEAIAREPDRCWKIDIPHPSLIGQLLIAVAVAEHLGW